MDRTSNHDTTDRPTANAAIRPLSGSGSAIRSRVLLALCAFALACAVVLRLQAVRTFPPDAVVEYVDTTASVGQRPFAQMKEAGARSLPSLLGRQVVIRAFGATVTTVWQGFLTPDNLPMAQASLRAVVQKTAEEESGTNITAAQIDGAVTLQSMPGTRKTLVMLTDGIEDIPPVLRLKELPAASLGAFPGLTVEYLWTRERPRAADLATLAGAHVECRNAADSAGVLADRLRGRQPWQTPALGGSLLCVLLALPLAWSSWRSRPVPPPAPPSPRVWVGVRLPGGICKGQMTDVGRAVTVGTASSAQVSLPQGWPVSLFTLTPRSTLTADIANAAVQAITVVDADPVSLRYGQRYEVGDGVRVLVSERHALNLIVADEEPVLQSDPSQPVVQGTYDLRW